MTHAWCQDIARDAAVRAAEDGRDRPLPTLGQAIAAPFACPACGGFGMDHRCKESCEECDGEGRGMFPKSGSASSAVEHENKGDGMSGSTWFPASEQPAPAAPFADAAERSSPVSKTGEGQSGMRTERVTLEIVRGDGLHVRQWPWHDILKAWGLGEEDEAESVRVVEEAAQAASGGKEHTVTEGDCLATVRDEGGRPMPKGPAPGLVAKQAASGGGGHISFQENGYANGNDSDRLGTGGVRCVGVGDGSVLGRDARGGVEVTQRPVAWLHEGLDSVFLFPNEELKLKCVPLYRSPPQPRGWLTEEERTTLTGVVGLLRDLAKVSGRNTADRCELTAVAIDDLRARSSPPEVVLPTVFSRSLLGDRLLVEAQVKDALAAAGVAVKEVGRG